MRHDDHEKKHYFRSSDRVFHLNGAWYFATREGDHGPYPNESQVQAEIRRFIVEKTELANFQSAREAANEVAEVEAPTKLEVIMPEDRPRMRPSEPMMAKYRVYL